MFFSSSTGCDMPLKDSVFLERHISDTRPNPASIHGCGSNQDYIGATHTKRNLFQGYRDNIESVSYSAIVTRRVFFFFGNTAAISESNKLSLPHKLSKEWC